MAKPEYLTTGVVLTALAVLLMTVSTALFTLAYQGQEKTNTKTEVALNQLKFGIDSLRVEVREMKFDDSLSTVISLFDDSLTIIDFRNLKNDFENHIERDIKYDYTGAKK